MKTLRICLAAGLALIGVSAIAPSAEAAHHLVRIKQVYTGAGTNQEFVVLQLTGTGENLVNGTTVRLYNGTTQVNTATFTSNPGTGQNQQTILIATAAAETAFGGVQADLEFSNDDAIGDATGAACFTSPTFGVVDCVGWGTETTAIGPTGMGTIEGAIPAGSRLERSIAAGCPTFFETTNDTNDSAADFSPVVTTPGSFTPRNAAAAITETPCTGNPPPPGGGNTPAKKKCKKGRKLKKGKCVKKKRKKK